MIAGRGAILPARVMYEAVIEKTYFQRISSTAPTAETNAAALTGVCHLSLTSPNAVG
jgi:hypothetical protein